MDGDAMRWEDVPGAVAFRVRLAKEAAGVLEPMAKVWEAPQKLLGGPTPLTQALAGALAVGGIGYGVGRQLEQHLPAEHFYGDDDLEGNRLSRNLTMGGAALGALPGLYAASVMGRTPDGSGNAPGFLGGLMSRLPAAGEEALAKMSAFRDATGAAGVASIPVDAFNRAIWNDVRNPPNPFGAKSPWGDDHQQLGTPAPVAAFASGLVSGAGALSGRDRVSPWQVGLAAARAAGTGYTAGLAFGSLLGGLAGLRPESQAALQRAGLWGGLIAGGFKALTQ